MQQRLRIRNRRTLSIAAAAALLLGLSIALGWHWSREPPLYLEADRSGELPAVAGFVTVSTLIETIDWLLDKPGGYLSNDRFPPSLWLDNMPSFEFGVLVQARDLARMLRSDYSRSRAQSTELADLARADTALNFSNDSWILPSTESKLREAREALGAYRSGLVSLGERESQFFADAENLREWLALVERRLGNLSQRLALSVSRSGPSVIAPQEPDAGNLLRPSIPNSATPWAEIDNTFFEARGSAWALLQFVAAAEVDFESVIAARNAQAGLEQIRQDLEAALAPLASPLVLNGSGYGLFANHSLVLASYLGRARSAATDLRELLALR